MILPLDIEQTYRDLPHLLAGCEDLDGLNRIKGIYLGRCGSYYGRLMAQLKAAPKEHKRELGAAINALIYQWEEVIQARQTELETLRRGGVSR